MTGNLLLFRAFPQNATTLLVGGVFQLAADPQTTERGNLFLRFNYITPQAKKDGGFIRILARAWLPVTDPIAVQINSQQFQKGDYLFIVGWASLQYDKARTGGENSPRYPFATFTFLQIDHIEPVPAESVESELQALADEIAARAQAAQDRRNAKPQAAAEPPADTKPAAPPNGRRQQPRRAAVVSNWSDTPKGIDLGGADEPDDELGDPFAEEAEEVNL